jgi:DNA repair exonuclease SbcCD nuclease subunit
MAITFVHSADWHIGKAFGSFGQDKAAVLRDAREKAITTIADAARRNAATHVLVAGDVLDSEGLSVAILRRLLSLLNAAGDLTWHLLPGNHDPDRDRGIWDRISAIGTPANVILHRKRHPFELAPGAVLLPAPLAARQGEEDPTRWFDEAQSGQDQITIGLAHGSALAFGSAGTTGGLIDTQRAGCARLDYLALGDWHGTKQVAKQAWYSGTPEPAGFVDNDAGNILVVSIAGHGAPPSVKTIRTGQYRWQRMAVEIGALNPASGVLREPPTDEAATANQLIRLDLSGTATHAEHAQLRTRLEELAPAYFDLTVRWDRLDLAITDNPAEVFQAPELAAIARQLATIASGDANTEEVSSDVARRAVEMLGRFAYAASER